MLARARRTASPGAQRTLTLSRGGGIVRHLSTGGRLLRLSAPLRGSFRSRSRFPRATWDLRRGGSLRFSSTRDEAKTAAAKAATTSPGSPGRGDDEEGTPELARSRKLHEGSRMSTELVVTRAAGAPQASGSGDAGASATPAKPPLAERARKMWKHVKEEVVHYWNGSKLLVTEARLAMGIVRRILQGYTLTRRERRQLVRTSADLARLVPFSVFIIVPGMEFFLPFALRLFPNMMPSTYTKEFSREENMKKQLKGRSFALSYLFHLFRLFHLFHLFHLSHLF